MAQDSDHEQEIGGLFDDPEDYYPPSPPPTTQIYGLKTGETLTLHLVGHSPLEAHHLWNGSRIVSEFFEADPSRVRGKSVLELGAGAGLPSLVCGFLGAKKVVVTDFPDADLVANMQKNVYECDEVLKAEGRISRTITPLGFVWGADPASLLAQLTGKDSGHPNPESLSEEANAPKFDVLILADLLFRHSEHGKLVKTLRETMAKRRESVAYVFFTSYRPWLRHKDLAFFDLAKEDGFVVEQVLERKMERPLFEGDPGDLEVQKTVLGFEIRWPAGQSS
jgi:EEF1A N-terminal glycine/lysine methyltransferase